MDGWRAGTVSLLLLGLGCDDGGGLSRHWPDGVLSDLTVDFGPVRIGSEAQAVLTIHNAGDGPLNLLAWSLEGEPVFAVGTELRSVGPGVELDLGPRFAPLAEGAFEGRLRLETDDPEQPFFEATLRGLGVAPPGCDDGNDCTDDRFEAEGEICLHSIREGSCNDGSACTANDRCDQGSCVGEPVRCDDGVDCTLDLCDPSLGCTFLPEAARCADDDPCTLDECTAAGCENPTAPDGHRCGEYLECDRVDVCVLGTCLNLPIPDGAPCSDGDRCSLEDHCSAGLCAGTATITPSELLATSRFLPDVQQATFLDGNLVVSGAGSDAPLWIVARDLDNWAPVGAASGSAQLYPLQGSRYVRVSNSMTGGIEVLDFAVVDQPRRLARRPVPTSAQGLLVADDNLFYCDSNGLASVDLSDPSHPRPTQAWGTELCDHPWATGGAFVAGWSERTEPSSSGSGLDTIQSLQVYRLGRLGPALVLAQELLAERGGGGGAPPDGRIVKVALDAQRLVLELDRPDRYLVASLNALEPVLVPVNVAPAGSSGLAGVVGTIAYLHVGETLRALDLGLLSQPDFLDYTLPLPGHLAPAQILASDADLLALRTANGRLMIAPRRGLGQVQAHAVRGQGHPEQLYSSPSGLVAVGSSGAFLLDRTALRTPTIGAAPTLPPAWFAGAGFTGPTLLDGPDGALGLYAPASTLSFVRQQLPTSILAPDGTAASGPPYEIVGRPEGESWVDVVFDGCQGLAWAQGSSSALPAQVLLLDRCAPSQPFQILSLPILDRPASPYCAQHPLRAFGAGVFSVIQPDSVFFIDASNPAQPQIHEFAWEAPTCGHNPLAFEGGRWAMVDGLGGLHRLQIFDMRGPLPVLLQSATLAEQPGGLWLDGPRLYLAGGRGREGALEVFDLRSNPPALVDQLTLPGTQISDLLIEDGLLYTVSGAAINVLQPACAAP